MSNTNLGPIKMRRKCKHTRKAYSTTAQTTNKEFTIGVKWVFFKEPNHSSKFSTCNQKLEELNRVGEESTGGKGNFATSVDGEC